MLLLLTPTHNVSVITQLYSPPADTDRDSQHPFPFPSYPDNPEKPFTATTPAIRDRGDSLSAPTAMHIPLRTTAASGPRKLQLRRRLVRICYSLLLIALVCCNPVLGQAESGGTNAAGDAAAFCSSCSLRFRDGRLYTYNLEAGTLPTKRAVSATQRKILA